MKVLLVCKSKVMENLGVMYLSAVVKQAEHECRIVDLPTAFNTAISWKPNLVGYSVMTGDQQKFIALNHRIRSQIHIASLFGGPHATFFPDDFPDDPVALGESEQDIADLLKLTAKYFDINSLPWPDRTDFPGMKIRDFITTRGCPYNCSYCYNDAWAKMFPEIPRVRTRSVGDVIAEINSVNPEFVYFQDSCFGVSMKWLREFSKQYRGLINIPYHCHLRPNQVTEERVLLLHDSNCVSVRIALESASGRLRKLMNRGAVDLSDVLKAVRLLRKWDIKLMIQNMIGIPNGTIEEDLETLEFNIKCHPAYGWVSIFSPYPGTELGDRCKKEGWYTGDYSEISDSFFDTSVLNFSPGYIEQLEVLQKVFALAVETETMPEIKELTHQGFPKLVHRLMRRLGDKRMYGGVI
jgi:radical SAM superfamily enzyme YgiQ (UPF0313 family)